MNNNNYTSSYNAPAWRGRVADFIFDPLDAWLLISLVIIYIASMFVLYSADGQNWGQLERKTIYTVLAFFAMWFIARFRPVFVSRFALPLYIVSLLMLVAVQVAGVTVNGATRWLDLGITRIQPSETMKIALPMILAWYFHRLDNQVRWYHWIVALIIIALPVALILKQPDLGTAILILASGLLVVFFAGLPWKAIFVAIIGAVISLPAIWAYGLHDYQRQRILTMFNPEEDKLGAGYHILQSMTAIGSGGVWGKGWLGGTQNRLDYIPERTTDFIFAVYGEEFGFIGNSLLVLMYGLIVARGLTIAMRARTIYGRLLAASLTMTIFFYAFINMGMVSGILPVVGVPLPLVSYGGTATLSIMVIIGMLMGIAADKHGERFSE